MRRITGVLAVAAIALLMSANAAQAHEERETRELAGTGSVPVYRTTGPTFLVCKTDKADFDNRIKGFSAELKAENEKLWTECQTSGYRHIQQAVDAVKLPNSNIKILPGLYLEEPSLAEPSAACAETLRTTKRGAIYGYPVLTWDAQLACPHLANLVAILDKKNLQMEGTGAGPLDVIVDAQYKKLNTIRADRADGVYFRNMTAQKSQFNAFYIMETDGFVVDKTLGRWNDEYAFLTFAVDHGLYKDCEGYGNGDSAFYPGAASNINKDKGHVVPRYAVEISHCYGHHNTLGYSGTAGDSVWVHDSVFTENTTGVATDSAFPDHPGMPQNHAKFERNIIANNNVSYYQHIKDGTCKKPFEQRGYEGPADKPWLGVVCPAVGLPVGGGIVNPGGNYNVWRDNYIYDNKYSAFVTSYVPAFVRNDNEWGQQFDTSHHNRYLNNHMGVSEKGESKPNGLNFWWDGQGFGNCWTGMSNTNIRTLPACGSDDLPKLGTHRYFGEPAATLKMLECADYSQGDQRIPAGCDWYGATGLSRVEVRDAFIGSVLIGLLAIGLFLRRRGSLLGLLITLAGLVLGFFGTVEMGSVLHPIGLALYGLGFILIGRSFRKAGTRKLGMLMYLIAIFALLGAVDHGIWMLPLLPVSPALIRIILELIWIPWALGAIIIGRRKTAPPAEPDPVPALV